MARYVIYGSVQNVEDFQKCTQRIADHFDSDVLAERYLDGLIDWNGNELDDPSGYVGEY